jgi:uncharacterized protein YjdB
MNKYFKKFSIMFVMSLVLVLGSCVSAFADESGWNQFDDEDASILYDNLYGWHNGDSLNFINSGAHDTKDKEKKSSVKFNFTGTQFRLKVQCYIDGRNKNLNIFIDNKKYNISAPQTQIDGHTEYYVSPILNAGEHSVYIEKAEPYNEGYIRFDEVDIKDGKLLPISESISLDESTINVSKGNSKQLAATTTPEGVEVVWTSRDPSIATVDSTGKVTGIKEGQVTITATTADGATATCTVTVTAGGVVQPPVDEPTGDANLYIELVDGNIKQYSVSDTEIANFISWYNNTY